MIHFEKNLPILLLALAVFVTGCSGKDPNPELRDPIYLDLRSTVGDYKKRVEDTRQFITETQEKMEGAEPLSRSLAIYKKDIREATEQIVYLKQQLKYYKIRAERRKLEARVNYGRAHERGEDWPDPTEYRGYLANKSLRNAPSNWNQRVPKLKDRIDKSRALASDEVQ